MSQTSATVQGCLALTIWSINATLMVALKHIPPLQFVAFSFGLGSLTIFAMSKFQRPKFDLPLCIMLATNQFSYICAFHFAPAAQVDLLVYLWPITLLILGAIQFDEQITKWHLLGSFLGFGGIALLMVRSIHLGTASLEHLPGYLCALYCAVSWALISIRLKQVNHSSITLIGTGCGCAALAAAVLSCLLETWHPITPSSWAVLLLMGMGAAGPSYALWQKGISNGHFKFLTAASYATPLLSILWLITVGYVEATPTLGVSCGMVTFGTCLPKLFRTSSNKARASS